MSNLPYTDNGLLFHMTQPTTRSTARIHRTEQTNQ